MGNKNPYGLLSKKKKSIWILSKSKIKRKRKRIQMDISNFLSNKNLDGQLLGLGKPNILAPMPII